MIDGNFLPKWQCNVDGDIILDINDIIDDDIIYIKDYITIYITLSISPSTLHVPVGQATVEAVNV